MKWVCTCTVGSVAEPDARLRDADLIACLELYVWYWFVLSNIKHVIQPVHNIGYSCALIWTCFVRIEHLEASVLSKLPYSLFGVLNPKVVILTTPNADFNVLFPGLTGFRHWDHKFEWTRMEFNSWYEPSI